MLLPACDAWPTIVDNNASRPISVQYLHQDYDYWSAPFPIRAGRAMPFAQAHWIQEIKGIKIKDGRLNYSWSKVEIDRLALACPSSEIARRVSFAGNCYLIYLGDGRLKAMTALPDGIKYEGIGNDICGHPFGCKQ
ncbi:hypothetical protein [Sphingobium yanoikuyae]|uniref:hypothetical protein n=1 Tax=Sphingobium yanoikuyae TaxID=13690 RepID=UPI0024468CF1|nr:hypothetical protein [Sphingobium yanoikuyae]MDH2148199.1 hypothetical protein [Sphingobium yanoikuyae]